ncbi:MAG: hypothetical protein GXO18_02420, partial [Aquificae bacterium]|nr:hypothetical protein [Aquificota bacterium]
MGKITPKYVINLSALGIDIKQLWNEKELRFLKRKELILKVGGEEFKVLETIGKTIREGRWKPAQKRDIKSLMVKLEVAYGKDIPTEAL